ncbi:unnamed protein product [Schistosoma rodhaini]|nr:unnamed protein product [Schistosoma rodhaini]
MSDIREDPPYPKSTEVDGFPQPYPPQYPDTVISEQPCPVITDSHFAPGPDPVNTMCSYCHKDITTVVTYKIGILTWVGCFGIFLVGLSGKLAT